jgi:hypothetical protein
MRVDPQPLGDRERAVLDFLLRVEYAGVDELRQQAVTAVVVSRCDCGCPTFDVATGPETPAADMPDGPAPVGLRIAPVSDEPPGDVILFLKSGRLSSVEYVYYSDRVPSEWPDESRLTVLL